jgi:hypothetical protein
MLFTVPLASTGMPPFFSVFLALTSPRPPSRVRAPPCSPQLTSRVTTVCIESPGDQSISCHKPLRIADNISPTSRNHPPCAGKRSSGHRAMTRAFSNNATAISKPLRHHQSSPVTVVARKAPRPEAHRFAASGLDPRRHPGVLAAMSSTPQPATQIQVSPL